MAEPDGLNPLQSQPAVRLSCEAMATRFEAVLFGPDPVRLRAAAEEALAEVERLDARLSRFRPDSDIARINRLAAKTPVAVEPWLFELLESSAEITRLTDGAFDITAAPLMRLWGLWDRSGRVPGEPEIENALGLVGIGHVELDPAGFTVRFDREGVEIDLGGIGKGFAVDRAVEILQDAGVESALVQGGTSSVRVLGRPPDVPAWRVGVRILERQPDGVAFQVVDAFSVSAIYGRSFSEAGVEYGHVIDPRTGRPVHQYVGALVAGPSAAVCDALATAMLVAGAQGQPSLSERFPDYRGIVVTRD